MRRQQVNMNKCSSTLGFLLGSLACSLVDRPGSNLAVAPAVQHGAAPRAELWLGLSKAAVAADLVAVGIALGQTGGQRCTVLLRAWSRARGVGTAINGWARGFVSTCSEGRLPVLDEVRVHVLVLGDAERLALGLKVEFDQHIDASLEASTSRVGAGLALAALALGATTDAVHDRGAQDVAKTVQENVAHGRRAALLEVVKQDLQLVRVALVSGHRCCLVHHRSAFAALGRILQQQQRDLVLWVVVICRAVQGSEVAVAADNRHARLKQCFENRHAAVGGCGCKEHKAVVKGWSKGGLGKESLGLDGVDGVGHVDGLTRNGKVRVTRLIKIDVELGSTANLENEKKYFHKLTQNKTSYMNNSSTILKSNFKNKDLVEPLRSTRVHVENRLGSCGGSEQDSLRIHTQGEDISNHERDSRNKVGGRGGIPMAQLTQVA